MENNYLIQKKPLNALFILSLPIIIGNFFQQAYTMADSAVVGRFVGEKALAAVGSSFALTTVFICIAIGGGMGASVIVGQHFGSGNYNKMKEAVWTALVGFLVISIVLGGVGLIFSKEILIALNTPTDVLNMATEYLNIYFIGLPFLFMYNVLTSMFNALGKSKIPLYFLIFSSVFNVILDLISVIQFKMGVAGVAWATLIAQGISAVLSFVVLVAELRKIKCQHAKIFDIQELRSMTKVALPSILQYSTVSIGMLLVQSVVNGFGSEALAGYSAAMRTESLLIVPMSSIGNAISSYTAQNIGANKPKRVIEGYHVANKIILVCAVICLFVLGFFYKEIISLFLGDDGTAVALATGYNSMSFMKWFYCLFGFKNAVDGLLRGVGDMKVFTIANMVNLAIRVLGAMLLAPVYGIAMVWYIVPIGWFANWVISFAHYRSGKWKNLYSKEVLKSKLSK